MLRAAFLLSCLTLTSALYADPLLSPQEAVKKMTAPDGFSVNLIAAEPDIVQPIAFCWDARGRIWVVEGNTYPRRTNNKPPGGDSSTPNEAQLKDIYGGEDRILIFSDEDGNGQFETRKVFAEKLNLVSGIEIGFGGVYVGAAPYLLHIPDKNSDDLPDGPPEILLDGWGWQDTHETLNSFIWGPDGWLYGCHGVFTHSNVGVVGVPPSGGIDKQGQPTDSGGKGLDKSIPPEGGTPTRRTPINCGYWRFHPVRRTFEVFAHGTSNSWGIDYNEFGDWFSEACVIPHFWHIIQGGYYLRQSNPLGHFNPYVYTNIDTIADHLHYIGATPHSGNAVSDAAGGGHAHCGLCIYNGDNFPPEYRGRAMMFNIHGQRINQEQLVPKGSGYVAKHLPDFVKANDKNFTGVALKVGPDGAVYFIDWYDKEKCHRVQPEVWDRKNGRIYRVKFDRTWKPWKGDVAADSNQSVGGNEQGLDCWVRRQRLRLTYERRWAKSGTLKLLEFHYAQTLDTDEYLRDYIKNLVEQSEKPNGASELWRLNASAMLAVSETDVFRQSSNDVVRAAAVRQMSEEIYFNPYILQRTKDRLRNELNEELSFLPEGTDPERRKVIEDKLASIAAKHSGMSYLTAEEAVRAYEELSGSDPSPRVRLAVASALQRLPPDDRWPIAEALIQHAEDATDHNLPQMYWYAIEPLVPANPERALALAEKSKIPLIAQHIARRLAESDGGVVHLIAALGKEKTASGLVYLMKSAVAGLKGRVGVPAPKGWDGAWANMDEVLARRPDAAANAAEIEDLRSSLAVAFGDRRAFPRLRDQVRDTKLSAERRELALATLVQGKDPELGTLVMALLDDPTLRLAALRALPQVP